MAAHSNVKEDLRNHLDSHLRRQIGDYFALRPSLNLGILLEKLAEAYKTIEGASVNPRSGVSRQETAHALSLMSGFFKTWDRQPIEFRNPLGRAQKEFLSPPMTWQELYGRLSEYEKFRFFTDQLLLLIDGFEGAVGILLDAEAVAHDGMTLGVKWARVTKRSGTGPWSITAQLMIDIRELIQRRNMVVHNHARYDPNRYHLRDNGQSRCWKLDGQVAPTSAGDPLFVDKLYLSYAFDLILQFRDEMCR